MPCFPRVEFLTPHAERCLRGLPITGTVLLSGWSILFWGAVTALAASYFLYPLILWLLVRITGGRRWPDRVDRETAPQVWIVVAAYNEEEVIESKLENLLALEYPSDRLRIAIVSDGSSDATCARARAYLESHASEERERFRIIERTERSGKALALSAEIPNLEGDVLVFSDANTMYDVDAVEKLVAPFADPRIGLVCGNLQYYRPQTGGAFGELLYWRYENILKSLEGSLGSLVVSNGSIYAIRLGDFEPVPGPVADDMAVPLTIAANHKLRVYAEDAIARESLPQRSTEEFRAKARIVAQGLEAIRLYSGKIRHAGLALALQLFLRKVLRWFAVPIMALMMIGSIFGSTPLLNTMLLLQIGFYSLALIGERRPRALPGLLRIPSYYCMVSAAAFRGFLDFLQGQSYATWEKSESTRTATSERDSQAAKILFLTHYFPPESNAPASRVFDMVRRWAASGHQITVITCAPNVPDGKVYEGFENRLTEEAMAGVRVIRVPTFIAANRGVILRTVNYLSYLISAGYRALRIERPDVVIATSPQFFCGWAGVVTAKLRGLPLVLEIRDPWPQAIVAVSALKNRFVIRALEFLEARMYAAADHIVTVAESVKAIILERGVEPASVSIVGHGVDHDFFDPKVEAPDLIEKYGLEGKFVVSFIGTIGMSCGLDVVPRASKLLNERGFDDVVFLLVGDGAVRHDLERVVRSQGVKNVIFAGLHPRSEIPRLLSISDCCLVHTIPQDWFRKVIPSKTYEAMAMQRPLVLSCGEAVSEWLDQVKAGISMDPGDEYGLADAIAELRADRNLREHFGSNGRAYTSEYNNRQRQAENYLELILATAGQEPSVFSDHPGPKENEAC